MLWTTFINDGGNNYVDYLRNDGVGTGIYDLNVIVLITGV